MLNQQEKRTASDIYLAFEYQWDFFILEVLKLLDEDTVVSFEYLDDVAKQTNDSVILYQVKHSVRKNAEGNTVNLTNRDSDLWKTIEIWMGFIEENEGKNRETYIKSNLFVLVTNKNSDTNDFADALQRYKQNQSIHEFRNRIGSIEKNGVPSSTVTSQIKKFLDSPYLQEFAQRISINFTPNAFEPEIKRIIGTRFAIKEEKIEAVYNHLMTKMRDDAKELIREHCKIQYNCYTIQEKYWTIIQEGRDKLVFRTDYPCYDGNPRDLLFIKQLIAVNDVRSEDCDGIVNYTNEWFQFHNNFKEMWNNHDINDRDVLNLTSNVHTVWWNSHKQAYRKLSLLSTSEELDDAANDILVAVRKEPLSLATISMGQTLSNGCFYYYSNDDSTIVSDMPRIGWHIDWKKMFKNNEQGL